MTGLLVVTFVAGGLHTLLWLPRALSLRRVRKRELAAERAKATGPAKETEEGLGSPENEI